MFRKRAHAHGKIKRAPLIETPSRSAALRERLSSPWLVVVQYVFNIVMVLLVLWLTGNQVAMQQSQVEVTDYLNGKGVQRDAERDQAEQDRIARSDATHQVLCNLINALEKDIGRELSGMRVAAKCELSPFQPSLAPETPQSFPNETSKLDPIVPGGGTSTGSPTPGSQSTTGGPGTGNGGRESPPATDGNGGGVGTTPGPEPERPAPPPPAEGDGGGLLDGTDFCVPLLGCLL